MTTELERRVCEKYINEILTESLKFSAVTRALKKKGVALALFYNLNDPELSRDIVKKIPGCGAANVKEYILRHVNIGDYDLSYMRRAQTATVGTSARWRNRMVHVIYKDDAIAFDGSMFQILPDSQSESMISEDSSVLLEASESDMEVEPSSVEDMETDSHSDNRKGLYLDELRLARLALGEPIDFGTIRNDFFKDGGNPVLKLMHLSEDVMERLKPPPLSSLGKKQSLSIAQRRKTRGKKHSEGFYKNGNFKILGLGNPEYIVRNKPGSKVLGPSKEPFGKKKKKKKKSKRKRKQKEQKEVPLTQKLGKRKRKETEPKNIPLVVKRRKVDTLRDEVLEARKQDSNLTNKEKRKLVAAIRKENLTYRKADVMRETGFSHGFIAKWWENPDVPLETKQRTRPLTKYGKSLEQEYSMEEESIDSDELESPEKFVQSTPYPAIYNENWSWINLPKENVSPFNSHSRFRWKRQNTGLKKLQQRKKNQQPGYKDLPNCEPSFDSSPTSAAKSNHFTSKSLLLGPTSGNFATCLVCKGSEDIKKENAPFLKCVRSDRGIHGCHSRCVPDSYTSDAFLCPVCLSKDGLNSKLPWKCLICGKGCRNSDELMAHSLSHDNFIDILYNMKTSPCPIVHSFSKSKTTFPANVDGGGGFA